MGIEYFINSKTLDTYLSDILLTYDTDQNGFTQKELSNAIKGMTTIFANGIAKLGRYDKTVFKELDTNNDEIVSYHEFDEYTKKEFKIDFYSLLNLKIIDICKIFDIAIENKKRSKNKEIY